MKPEIPSEPSFNVGTQFTKVIGLAAACMADDLVPRLELQNISVFVEGDERTTQFNFPDNPDVARIFAEWADSSEGKYVMTNTARICRAFHYWNQFVNIIKDMPLAPRPDETPAGWEWTINTKIPATALALLNGEMLSHARLHKMVYRNGRDKGYLLRTGEVTKAYEDPDRYIKENPDTSLSYIIAGFYHRDHLRDIVKQVPARHIFRDGTDVHLIPEPQPNKEIPCPLK